MTITRAVLATTADFANVSGPAVDNPKAVSYLHRPRDHLVANATLAQLVEQRFRKPQVTSSSLVGGSFHFIVRSTHLARLSVHGSVSGGGPPCLALPTPAINSVLQASTSVVCRWLGCRWLGCRWLGCRWLGCRLCARSRLYWAAKPGRRILEHFDPLKRAQGTKSVTSLGVLGQRLAACFADGMNGLRSYLKLTRLQIFRSTS
jgi:hypothetical protein